MKKIFISALLAILTLNAQAQHVAEFQNMIPVSTASPNSASLGKFGNIPVSYTTGIPSVTIPLFEIGVGGLKIPLSLDYHGGGVRVDEIASSVGTSWAMSGIPEMNRNVIGLPDEGGGGYLQAPSFDSLYSYFNYANYTMLKKKQFAQYIMDVRDGFQETEPDIFSYSLAGSSGKVVYRPNGSIMQIPFTNNKIELLSGPNFRVTDPNGTIYIFDQAEFTQQVSGTGMPSYRSAWRISKMIDHSLADTVYFSYTPVSSAGIEHTWNFSYTLGTRPSTGNATSDDDATGPNSSVSTISHVSELFPSEIRWRGGKVVFRNLQDRTDRTSELRLDSVKVYARINGTFQLTKAVKLYQSYFYSNPTNLSSPDNRNYRLRLDSVATLPVGSMLPRQTYQMTYNTTPMAPNESFAQDVWGFNNGAFLNQSLMPAQSVLWKGLYRTIGTANCTPDSTDAYVQACMLQTIRYPTKGTSAFEFEPHRYPLNYATTQAQAVSCDAYGSVQTTTTASFTVTANQSAFAYSVVLSSYNYPGVSDRPQVRMVDQATGQQIFFVSNPTNPSQSYSTGTVALSLTVGHTYVITTNIYTADSRVQATCQVSWQVPVTGIATKYGGGLRIKSITNYDLDGAFIGKEQYQYGSNGTGQLLTDASYLLVNYENVFYQYGYCGSGTPEGVILCPTVKTGDIDAIYQAKSILPATQFSGSPVVYGSVTKYDVNSAGAANGKTVYSYDIYSDQAGLPSTDYGTIGFWLISNPWRNGFLNHQYTYKGSGSSYSPVNIKEYKYRIYRADTLLGLKIKPLHIKMSGGQEVLADTTFTRSGPPNNIPSSRPRYFMGRVPTFTGTMLLQSESDTTFDDSGQKIVTVKNNYYDDLTHIFPTETETFNSSNETLASVIKYPHDLASGTNVYQKMLNRNIVSPTVRFQQLKNGTQLALANVNYNDWFGNASLFLPQTVEEQVQSAPIETRTLFNKYDAYGNILEQQKAGAPVMGYKWGYYSQYPVATAVNATSTEFFYEGFEENTGLNVTAGTAHTGSRFYNGNSYTFTWARPNARSYVISYWYRTSAGTWAYSPEAAYASGSAILSGGTAYDDIRIHPVDAQMSTFTYLPLVGMTSGTDARNMTTYYEYDGLQRLLNIRDQKGNILKSYDYHYRP